MCKKSISILASIICLLFFNKIIAQERPIALVGGTIVDVTNYGNTTHDIADAIVIIQDGKIIYAGEKNSFKIPKNAQLINIKGKYIIPGLIDCFSVIGTQGQANAHLYYGVTTIVAGSGDDRRKGFLPNGNPSPDIKKLAIIPTDSLEDVLEKKEELSAADIGNVEREIDKLDSFKNAGVATILIQHMFPKELMDKMVEQCHRYDINTIGEMQYAPYSSGLKYGVNSFVHTSRYILGVLPDSLFTAFVLHPDSTTDKKFIKYFYSVPINSDPSFHQYANALAASNTALMPTLSMLYTSLPDHKNIWKEPGANLTDPKDVFLPMDTATGKSTSFMSTRFALRQIEFEKAFIKSGVHYITGSGADAFGSLPGVSELIEIEMLHQYGLTNRQAIAAATNNPSIFNHWDNIGLIATGRNADILVLSADPAADLENLKQIEMLWLNGKLIDRNSLLLKK